MMLDTNVLPSFSPSFFTRKAWMGGSHSNDAWRVSPGRSVMQGPPSVVRDVVGLVVALILLVGGIMLIVRNLRR
jgi:hypothetical protein